ncbi:hypothetical protein ANCCEY_06727 [Ancylostoma ceylanicum]|uniref:DDE-1 domain-containing protein n=1 Tax=Ancylostoma ceylanicum TaxID=53326 RepID=A0A0D6LVQ6_9BILA|nr:hypothetical protein ANCCEY_06727 [Ancylostoma ceylanicum]
MVLNAEQFGRKRDQILLLWDNCRPHFVKKTQEKLKQLQLEVLAQPAYGPDIAPSAYQLFRRLEHWLKGKQLESENDLKLELCAFLNSPPSQKDRCVLMDMLV